MTHDSDELQDYDRRSNFLELTYSHDYSQSKLKAAFKDLFSSYCGGASRADASQDVQWRR
jgi:hypothetical protein